MFTRIAQRISAIAGSPVAFVVALAVVIVWALLGPLFHYNDGWQLTINTGTTIVTFLLGFLIQYMQNRSGAQTDRVLRHVAKIAEADHAEHGRLLAEIHAHITCQGHTTLGED